MTYIVAQNGRDVAEFDYIELAMDATQAYLPTYYGHDLVRARTRYLTNAEDRVDFPNGIAIILKN